VYQSNDCQYKYKAEDQAKRSFYNLRQTPDISCQEYFEHVKSVVDMIISLGGSLSDNMHLKDELQGREPRGGWTQAQLKEAREKIHNKKVAHGILVRADRSRYGKLIEGIENDFLKGHDDYPQTPTEAYNLLVNYRNYGNTGKRNAQQRGLDQVAFITEGKRTKLDGSLVRFLHTKCFKCGEFGHYKSNCSGKTNKVSGETKTAEEASAETALTTMHVTLAVMKKEINPMWILCDNESTVDVFKNKDILSNIRRTNKPIRLKGIEVKTLDIKEEGDLLGYGRVYYHPQVTANILSFHNMAKTFDSIKYDNNMKDAFLVERDDGSVFEFTPSKEGLYYYHFTKSIERKKKLLETKRTMMIDNIEKLQRRFTNREIDSAEKARRLYVILGRPSEESFELMIKKGKIINNPVSVTDFRFAKNIYGKDLGVIKGKTVRD
jgi:hypothetical protein